MSRLVPCALAVVCLLGFAALAEAAKKKNTVVGTIKAVSDDGKQITVTVAAKKKKKEPATDKEITITDKTTISYVGIEDKSQQKLQVGYAVTVVVKKKDKSTAVSIEVSKEAAKKKKKKKENKE